MVKAIFQFPRGFLWGCATASHQVEGGNHNNQWWAWEQQPGRILEGHKSGYACEWWNGRWREDFDRAAEGHQNAHRLSLEWSRIQPAIDRWDEQALDRYRAMMRGLYERSMTPLVTLQHFSLPLWVEERGGWENGEIVGWFETYVRKVVEALKESVSLWVTINEPMLLAVEAYAGRHFPPGKGNLGSAIRAVENLVRAHAAAYHTIHSIQPQARVGISHNIRPIRAAHSWSPLDRLVASLQNDLFNETIPRACSTGTLKLLGEKWRIPAAKGTQDFFGIDYYTREKATFSLLKPGELFGRRFYPPEAELSPSGFLANEPLGFYEVLKWANHFNMPIIVTENGVDDAEDRLRPRYMLQHIHQMWRACNFNFPVKGYFHWSLVDNFEWERGWTQRFGLWELDPQTQVRKKRASASLFAEICTQNGISSETAFRYAPETAAQIFPE